MRSRVEGQILSAGCGDQDAIADPVLAAMDVASVGLVLQLAAEVGSILSRELGRKKFLVDGRTSGLCLVVGQRVQQERSSMVDIILRIRVSPTRRPTPRKRSWSRTDIL